VFSRIQSLIRIKSIDLFLFLIRHNLPSDDFEQGPLADLPDYSYLSKIDWFENNKEGVVF